VSQWSAKEAADRLRDPAVADLLIDEPALVVDLRDGEPTAPSFARVPCPVIGLVREDTSWPVDLALVEGAPDTLLLADDVDAAAAVLVEGAHGPASNVLVQVLRATAGLPVEQALAVESMAYSLLLTGPDFRSWLASRRVPREPVETGGVAVRREGSVLEVVLDRPLVRNAYNVAIRDGLVEALGLAVLDPSLNVLIRGNGPAFCSGGDLRDFGTSTDLVSAHAVRLGRHPGALLHALGDRVEVRVHGACVGAGVELPAFAGRVVAHPDAWFRLPELAMGTIPGAGGTASLPRRIGTARTLLLALSGLALPAVDALRWGLVDELSESDVPAT
jgi:enoyl-CoA hydratase/carnithine racemase